jgi:hypothetical protein
MAKCNRLGVTIIALGDMPQITFICLFVYLQKYLPQILLKR